MRISEEISTDTKEAMKARDKSRVETLRMVRSALGNEQIQLGHDLSEDEEIAVLRRQLKQREESAEAYRQAGRDEQAESESAEAEIIRGYLPAPMSREELESVADRAIQETEATGMKDMGNVMGRAKELSGNRAEGRELSAVVRERLQEV
ncbi:GatB/YqeY domain-containing protein [Rubrobacter aplysinae]|uniref:GatB/YqeY domain-containing protein n=1 Tax=Rubrobacter aplysinae TaxID=909625 RepID=UPI00064BBCB0|nr:GatB/YqeY domain-containing protein [Rubrobacter aplysinae]